jgi:NAD(P)-dependent dehydrogenase (short-subunit alcohol dehydrogenase family)
MRALQGKVAFITRGNSGIGLRVAKRFVVEDAFVFITGRRFVSSARRSSSYSQRVRVVSGGRGPSANSGGHCISAPKSGPMCLPKMGLPR